MEELYYLGFSMFSGIGPANFTKLLSHFGTAEHAWKADASALFQVLGAILGQKFVDFRKTFSLEKYVESLNEKNIRYVCLFEEKYPKILKGIQNPSPQSSPTGGEEDQGRSSVFMPPYVLYYKGNGLLFQEEKSIGIVGTRKVTDYGREVTEKLTADLVGSGFTIVSGLAFGVDGIAHTTTLENHGKTLAVLGGGVDMCTPVEHQKIYDSILENGGCIVSTVVPGERPIKGSFPARNKIVAGLSLGILVTEGAADSGALITADYAQKFSRPVFAVPGPITSDVSKGTNNLIKKGAIPVTDSGEILDRLGIMENQSYSSSEHDPSGKVVLSQESESRSNSSRYPKGTSSPGRAAQARTIKGDNPEEQKILELLQINPLHFDDIVRKMSRDSSSIGSLLSLMELKGFIRILSDGKYSLNF